MVFGAPVVSKPLQGCGPGDTACKLWLRRGFRNTVMSGSCSRAFVKTQLLHTEACMGTILLIVLVLLLVGALPTWPYSSGWGYYPSGGLGLILLVVLMLALTGRL